MADDVSIREAQAADLGELTSLAVAAGSPDAASGQLGMVLRDGRLLVALDRGRPVGVAGSLRVGSATFVSDLFVVPAAQGRGHGRRLVEALLHGVDQCVVFSSHHPAAQRLYESFGMRPLGRLLYLEHGERRRYVPDGSPLAADLFAQGWTAVDDDIVMATPGWEWPAGLLEASPGRFWPDGHDHAR